MADESQATVEIDSLEDIEQFLRAAGSDHTAVFGGAYEGGIHAQQVPDEFAPFILYLMESGEPIKSYLEIGVAAGGSTFLVNHFLRPGKIVLVDDGQHWKAWRRADILKDVPHQIFYERSDNEVIVKQVSALGPFDLILLDADHAYPSVKVDTTVYLPMLRPGGFWAMHDTVYFADGPGRVMRELKEDPGMEFIEEYISKKDTACGLALFRKVAE